MQGALGLPVAGPSGSHSRSNAASSQSPRPSTNKRSRSETFDADNSDLDDADADTPEHDPSNPQQPPKVKRKRNRAALSCSACKKRKIKCDRKLPCEACIKRGEQALCKWEQPKVEPPPQPFALAVEHDNLRQRVTLLESVLKRLAPDVFDETSAQMPILPVPPRPLPSKPASVEEQQDSDVENVEDAALVLEELALHHKLTRLGPKTGKARERTPASGLDVAPHSPSSAAAAAASTNLPEDPVSRAMASLLVPAIDSRRQLVLNDIYEHLPQRKSELDWMLRHYFERVDWAWHLHHKPTFLAEYDAFCTLRAQDRHAEIDPLWLACFAMTLCLSVNSLDAPVSTPLVSITAHDLDTLPWRYFECAQSALECGDWTGKPRFRTLQAIVLFAPFFLFAGNRASAERHQTYIGAALRMAQSMGLHKLGSDPSVMPTLSDDDELNSGLPPGTNTLKREMALRMLTTLLFLDYTSLRIKTSLPPHLVTSALPGNYNDVDLSPTSVVPPRPDNVTTDISLDLVKFRIALEQRKFKEMMEGDLPFNYESIVQIDANYRAILDSLPTELHESYIPPLGEPLTSLWRRNMAIQSIQSRILRLHRPWMSRGWTIERYRDSTAKAIQSARSILACQISLNSAPLLKSGFQLLNCQIAIVVLFMSLWCDSSQPAHEAAEDVASITATFGWFEKHVSSRASEVRMIARSSLEAFKLLLQAWQEREERRRAGVSFDAHEESYGRLLKRVGAVVSSSTSSTGIDPLMTATQQPHHLQPAYILPTATSEPSLGSGMTLEALLAPVGRGMQEDAEGQSEKVFASSAALGLTDAQPDLQGDFDLAILEGPEYADPSFSWNSWTALNQFASLGTF
ncbi:uncharacterized protein JCM10292_003360 [Rhodotorula paludigena]|uniref:uncharacterized protein n=1 Tax=Rhodotorula paludigena TaxID=86838 RepID=UPI00317C5D01